MKIKHETISINVNKFYITMITSNKKLQCNLLGIEMPAENGERKEITPTNIKSAKETFMNHLIINIKQATSAPKFTANCPIHFAVLNTHYRDDNALIYLHIIISVERDARRDNDAKRKIVLCGRSWISTTASFILLHIRSSVWRCFLLILAFSSHFDTFSR